MNGKPSLRDERGNIVLYVVLVMAVLINTVVIISNLMISELRQASNIDNAARAYYFAESGVEKALFDYRKNNTVRPDGDCDLPGIDCTLTSQQDSLNSLNLELTVNDSYQINFDQAPSGIESLRAVWDVNGSWLEVTILEWDAAAMDWQDDSVNKVLLSGGSGVINAFNAGQRYRVRIKALYQDVNNAMITFYNQPNAPAGAEIAIPGSIIFTAQGRENTASAQVSAAMPPAKSVLGLFDYVLFSRQAIVK